MIRIWFIFVRKRSYTSKRVLETHGLNLNSFISLQEQNHPIHMASPTHSLHLILCVILFCPLAAHSQGLPSGAWLNHGGDLFNRRFASKEHKISPKTVHKLALKWKFFTGDDVSATPAIFNGTIYFPSWNGNIYAVNEANGSLVWEQNISNITGINGTRNSTGALSRSTPTIVPDADLIIVGIIGPSVVMALTRSTGQLTWLTRLDSHPASIITMSGTYYKGNFYVGVSSVEESYNIDRCCVFRGSFVKLDVRIGRILWKTYMLPDNHNKRGDYAGAASWGSSPSIDPLRNHIYIATGNLYSAPGRVIECRKRQVNRTVPVEPDPCIEPENHSNSMLALDLDSGKIRWYRQLGGYDVSSGDCLNINASVVVPPSCPPLGNNPDTDFGEAPMVMSISHPNGTIHDIVVAVQKSGIAWALDRDTGGLVWSKQAGPGSVLGGGMWGSATDGARVYTNIVNLNGDNFILLPSNKSTNGSGWVAMGANNGKILWSTASPQNLSIGPVSVANGVVFVGETTPDGNIYGMDAKSGQILWSYKTNATVYGGASINNGCVYVGHGYSVASILTKGSYVFAFCL